MRVRDWQDIMTEVADSDVDPEGWRAIAGDRDRGVGEDMYLGHPVGGVFHLKTYAKNPFQVKGVGTEVARKLDDDIGSFLPTEDEAGGRFAVQQPPEDEDDAERKATHVEEVVKAHADAPTSPDALFSDLMEAVDSPAFGPMDYDQYDRPERLNDLAATFEDAQEALETEFEDIVEDDEVGKGFH